MVAGFSPYQLVYGRNPKLPSTLSDELPALEGITTSEMVAKHLNASNSARRASIAAEISEKIQRALRHKVRTNGKVHQSGAHVYFKRDEQKEWKGPATVIGQDGKTVILMYGSNIVRAHETHVQEMPYSFERDTEEGRSALLDMLRHQKENEDEIRNGKKEIEAVVNPVENIEQDVSGSETL